MSFINVSLILEAVAVEEVSVVAIQAMVEVPETIVETSGGPKSVQLYTI